MSLTVHITIPRREWENAPVSGAGLDKHDMLLGRAVREETERGIARLRTRSTVDAGELNHIEVTLVETAHANFQEDPEAHRP